jgi:hypothetical protein
MDPQPMGKVRCLSRLAGRVAARSTVRWSSLWIFLGICLLAAVVGGPAVGLPPARGAATVAGMPPPAQGPALLPQRITFDPPQAASVGQPARLSASTDVKERLVVSFRSDSPTVCIVSGRSVTTVAAGTCDITAFQGGSAAYAAAQASGSFQVTAREVRSAQQIVFGPVPGTTVDVPIVLTASSQTLVTKGQDSATVLSGLAVSYTSQNRRVCTVSGATVVPRAGGQCRQVAFELPGIIPLGRGFALLPDHDHSAGAGDEISQASVA